MRDSIEETNNERTREVENLRIQIHQLEENIKK